ncbi:hypothetical protein HNY73_006301 [Argiope bruennichi]|uniref:Uncharacterized protein n=1 Tax=Argiope bruennichi TaxID=94029 RepID=A0A8T0FPQ7_ARGBR|nr:hypothetical protein HNY73_006301 [Argiope bruennichi]
MCSSNFISYRKSSLLRRGAHSHISQIEQRKNNHARTRTRTRDAQITRAIPGSERRLILNFPNVVSCALAALSDVSSFALGTQNPGWGN